MQLKENKTRIFICLICKQKAKQPKEKTLNLCDECLNSQTYQASFSLENPLSLTKTFPEINKISNKIYLGNYDGQKEKEILKHLEVTSVLACGANLDDNNNGEFAFLQLKFFDMSTENLFRVLRKDLEFIEKSEWKVYVHCQSGVSRSASVVSAFLMWKEKMKCKKAVDFTRRGRRCVFPNGGFYRQLEEFGELLEKNNYELGFLKDSLYLRFYDQKCLHLCL